MSTASWALGPATSAVSSQHENKGSKAPGSFPFPLPSSHSTLSSSRAAANRRANRTNQQCRRPIPPSLTRPPMKMRLPDHLHLRRRRGPSPSPPRSHSGSTSPPPSPSSRSSSPTSCLPPLPRLSRLSSVGTSPQAASSSSIQPPASSP